ncbi:MAG TPA: squalene/phytoene synthase family protein [Ktedonobacterales bacterium]|nr:squalene/phytoene synthase family protein [Ktedonobacterales bacterium]
MGLARQRNALTLPMRITRDASKQAYYTVRFLVDRDRMLDAYRAYAYFRWVDDRLDQYLSERCERLAFVERQQALVDCGYWGLWPDTLTDEERMLEALIAGDSEAHSGLQSYIRHMMAVMAFDAERRGRLISERELSDYVRHLATAVTDALHYFIGHQQAAPHSEARYLPAMAAHITHMLRDTYEDLEAGYFNMPHETLEAGGIGPHDVASEPYREWVRSRVDLARSYFAAGSGYLDQVVSLRCRLAGYAYMARFAGILDAIEREGYQLRPAYPECKRMGYGLRMSGSVGASALLRRSRKL